MFLIHRTQTTYGITHTHLIKAINTTSIKDIEQTKNKTNEQDNDFLNLNSEDNTKTQKKESQNS